MWVLRLDDIAATRLTYIGKYAWISLVNGRKHHYKILGYYIVKIWNHLPAQAVNTKWSDNLKEAALPVLMLMQPPVGSSIL